MCNSLGASLLKEWLTTALKTWSSEGSSLRELIPWRSTVKCQTSHMRTWTSSTSLLFQKLLNARIVLKINMVITWIFRQLEYFWESQYFGINRLIITSQKVLSISNELVYNLSHLIFHGAVLLGFIEEVLFMMWIGQANEENSRSRSALIVRSLLLNFQPKRS